MMSLVRNIIFTTPDNNIDLQIKDLNTMELIIMLTLVFFTILLGFLPNIILGSTNSTLMKLLTNF